MQYKSSNGFALGVKSKSNMAEFSANPDDRKKSEVSIDEHNKRTSQEKDEIRSYRVFINKQRVKNGLYSFTDSKEFEDIKDDSDLDDEDLKNFLVKYNRDDPETMIAIKTQKPINKTSAQTIEINEIFTSKMIMIDREAYIESLTLCDVFNMEHNKLIVFLTEKGNGLKDWKVPKGYVIKYQLVEIKDKEVFYVPLTLITYIIGLINPRTKTTLKLAEVTHTLTQYKYDNNTAPTIENYMYQISLKYQKKSDFNLMQELLKVFIGNGSNTNV